MYRWVTKFRSAFRAKKPVMHLRHVPVEINGIRYATPYWVVKAGAKGIERPEFGSASWTPDWDDPVFLEKLDNFHKAFAEKYDGKPWVRYVDVGSIGDWGEGHTWSSTRIPPTLNEVKTHINLYLKHYKNTQLIVTDDLLASTKSEKEKQELLNYALEKRILIARRQPYGSGLYGKRSCHLDSEAPGVFCRGLQNQANRF